MRLVQPSISSPDADQTDIDPHLLRKVQSYLECEDRVAAATEDFVASWQQFYQTYDPVIRRFALCCKLPGTDLDECTQEAWLKLISKLPQLQYDPRWSKFQTRLFAIIRNQMIDFFRRRQRCGSLPLTAEDRSVCDIAQSMGLTTAQVLLHVSRLKKRLRQRLQQCSSDN